LPRRRNVLHIRNIYLKIKSLLAEINSLSNVLLLHPTPKPVKKAVSYLFKRSSLERRVYGNRIPGTFGSQVQT
jgi:hypothetical protein